VTVTNPFASVSQNFTRNAGNSAAAAANAYDRKTAKWRSLLAENSLKVSEISTFFQPIAVTALGVKNERSLKWLKRFSDVCAVATVTKKNRTSVL
jgi:hypothetical protein